MFATALPATIPPFARSSYPKAVVGRSPPTGVLNTDRSSIFAVQRRRYWTRVDFVLNFYINSNNTFVCAAKKLFQKWWASSCIPCNRLSNPFRVKIRCVIWPENPWQLCDRCGPRKAVSEGSFGGLTPPEIVCWF